MRVCEGGIPQRKKQFFFDFLISVGNTACPSPIVKIIYQKMRNKSEKYFCLFFIHTECVSLLSLPLFLSHSK